MRGLDRFNLCVWMWIGILCVSLSWISCSAGPNSKDRRQADIQYDLGVNDLKSGRFPDAIRDFVEAIKLDSEFAQAFHGLGLVYYLLNDYPNAIENFNKALKIRPEYSEVCNNLARVYISQGKFHDAIPLLVKALDNVFLPERYLAESNLGWAMFQTGETEEGMRRVKNAIAQNDHYCVGYEYLGMMHQSQKDLEQAIEQFKKLIELCPQYTQGHLLLGKALLMQGDERTGCASLETCRTQGPMTGPGQECDRLYRLTCPKIPPPVAPSSPAPPTLSPAPSSGA
jgi:type IV pilus assembly protein PilF